MRRARLLSVSLIAIILLVASSSIYADEVTQNIQSIILDNFFEPQQHEWIVTGSNFVTQGYPQSAMVKTWPDALYRQPPQGTDIRSLGIHAKFDRMGYNYIEITPATKDANGQLVPTPIDIPGRMKSLDVWMWGSYRNYYVEAQLQDYRGIVHVLRLGSLDYRGWEDLTVGVPSSIPQSVTYIPSTKGLKLLKFVIWSTPNTPVDDFYTYINQIKVITDTFESPWDGETLANPSYVDKLWSAAGVSGPAGTQANQGTQSAQSGTAQGK
ncbi:MAG TPA: flagellar filament outer layer protein FlaA [Spirochaetia bacterium]|nr:flagellar filament outer layer protein FlaA [Spirochaetia bacterium]